MQKIKPVAISLLNGVDLLILKSPCRVIAISY